MAKKKIGKFQIEYEEALLNSPLCMCGCGKQLNICNFHRNQGIPKYIKGHANRGRKINTKEHKEKLFKINFKGGSNQYWHNKAWGLFGEDHCEICGMTNDEHNEFYGKRLNMHNRLNEKDYTIMESLVWMTLCESCHGKEEQVKEYQIILKIVYGRRRYL